MSIFGSKKETIKLHIAEGYAAHWGPAEGCRELVSRLLLDVKISLQPLKLFCLFERLQIGLMKRYDMQNCDTCHRNTLWSSQRTRRQVGVVLWQSFRSDLDFCVHLQVSREH